MDPVKTIQKNFDYVSLSVSSCKELIHIKLRKTCVKSIVSFKFDVIAFSYLKLITCDQQHWNIFSQRKHHNYLKKKMLNLFLSV